MSAIEVGNGYVDLHCHGGAGFYFSDSNPENIEKAIQFHRSHGTSMLLASLVTATIDDLAQQIRRLIPFCEQGLIAGIHLEGPYLAKARCGAHDPQLLRTPKIDEISTLLDVGKGHITMITIAPELDGALDAIEILCKKSVIPAIGHSAGTYDDAKRAIAAGAQLVTHFSNGMSKLADGEHTFATAILEDSEIPFEIIFDGHHVSAADLGFIFEKAGERAILVTDAMSAAGQPDGHYRIGALEVSVTNGVARLVDSDSLAGSTLTMNQAVANAREFGLSDTVVMNSARDLPLSILQKLR